MHSLWPILALSLLASTAHTLQPRQNGPDPASASAQFSSAAAQLISLYIPPTLAVPFGIAVQSAASVASVTGDINSIVESALTAATPPAFFSALPTAYSSNLSGLASAISALRGAASTGVSGASRVSATTMTGAETAVLVLTLSDSLGATYVSSTTVVVSPSAVGGSGSGTAVTPTTTTVAAVVVTTTDSAGVTVTSTQSVTSASSAEGVSSSTPPPSSSSGAPPPSSSSTSGLAAPTQVPLAAAGAGVLGLVGLLVAL